MEESETSSTKSNQDLRASHILFDLEGWQIEAHVALGMDQGERVDRSNSRKMINAAKYHGYGNDFIIVPADQVEAASYRRIAKVICDRHFGIGADGCVFLESADKEEFSIRIFNRDGSEAGMSGNGTRCAAAFVHHRGLTTRSEIRFRTVSGVKEYALMESSFPVWLYSSKMGFPGFFPAEIPFAVSSDLESIRNFEVAVGERSFCISALSVGNPQCVVFVEELPGDELFDTLGRGLSVHPLFPEGTNVSFVLKTGPQSLRIKIWERGVGPTLSSGTGCCGAAVEARVENRVQSPVTVQTETGSQVVDWAPGEEIQLSGEARFIADVEFYGAGS